VIGKLSFLLSYLGQVIGWDCGTANVKVTRIRPFIACFEDRTVIFSAQGVYLHDIVSFSP
jgi:hypothetical protein